MPRPPTRRSTCSSPQPTSRSSWGSGSSDRTCRSSPQLSFSLLHVSLGGDRTCLEPVRMKAPLIISAPGMRGNGRASKALTTSRHPRQEPAAVSLESDGHERGEPADILARLLRLGVLHKTSHIDRIPARYPTPLAGRLTPIVQHGGLGRVLTRWRGSGRRTGRSCCSSGTTAGTSGSTRTGIGQALREFTISGVVEDHIAANALDDWLSIDVAR